MKYRKLFEMADLKAPSPLHAVFTKSGFDKSRGYSQEPGARSYVYRGDNHAELGRHLEAAGFTAGTWVHPNADPMSIPGAHLHTYHKDDPDGTAIHAALIKRSPPNTIKHYETEDQVHVYKRATFGWTKNDPAGGWNHQVRVQNHILTGPIIFHDMQKRTQLYAPDAPNPHWEPLPKKVHDVDHSE